MEKLVEQFCSVTGIENAELAKNYLEACGGNIEMAVEMHMDNIPAASGTTADTSAATNSNSMMEDEVRAPIPQKREVLVEQDIYIASHKRRRQNNPTSVFDKFRDFQAEAKQQEELLNEGESSRAASNKKSAHLIKLEDLFRPPLELIHHGTLASAQGKGKLENKWLLVNIQNTSEFACQVLNRDIWKDASVRTLIQKHFIFWQVYHDSVEGRKYSQFYPISSWPYISILHPITAELQKSWTDIKLTEFLQELRDFVLLNPPDGVAPNGISSNTSTPMKADPLLEASEESQIEAAIKASMREAEKVHSQDLKFESDSEEGDNSGDELETFTGSSDGGSDNDEPNQIKISQKSKNKGKQPKSGTNVAKSSSQPSNGNTNIIKSSTDSSNIETAPTFQSDESTNWKDYISETGTDIQILFRKPDQSRSQWTTKTQYTVKALLLYVSDMGYDMKKYELVANFPRRKISELSPQLTFEEAAFQKQETFYIQEL